MSTFGANTPFILIARCHVKEERLQDYLQAAEVADAAVKASEPGMLHHTFDRDPNDELSFVWSEVYANDSALLFHLTNPPLVKFVEQHGEMGDDFSIEVYGTLAQETKDAFSAAGFPIKYFDTKFGYSRVGGQVASSDMDAEANVKLVQGLVDKYMAGDPAAYIAGCHDEFKGDILAGLVPGGENIVGTAGLQAMMGEIGKVMEVKKFAPANWVGVGNNVFFTVDWEFVHVPSGKTVTTTATVRKVIRDGKICEKYHRVNAAAILKQCDGGEPAAAA